MEKNKIQISKEYSFENIKITEVGPRDGLQNESTHLSTEDKIEFINGLISAGLTNIEVTSFVSPKKIPQLQDAEQVFKSVIQMHQLDVEKDLLKLYCLVPNLAGWNRVKDLGVKDIAIFTSTSNTFNLKNIGQNVHDSFDIMKPVVDSAREAGVRVRGYVSTVFGCPYEGKIDFAKVKDVIVRFIKLGVNHISLGDTIGVGAPGDVLKLMTYLNGELKSEYYELIFPKLGLHFHDTRGLALANILMGLNLGIKEFDSSAGGLGGCPYAAGASGNVATEDVVKLFNSLNINSHSHPLNLIKIYEVSSKVLRKISKNPPSKFLQTFHQPNFEPFNL
jgi:hydroxymethylglutaryl-CoA lyase